uniref:Olfactory receptor n=1 Tax=Haemonchus placei TaxID=6290 RepID=A0A0N4VZL5_HAEPC
LCVTNWAIRYNASAIASVCVHLVCVYAGYEVLVNPCSHSA